MEKSALEELQNVIERLTGPDGCPWDKEQSPESLADYIIEESHELVSAIRSDKTDDIREELGDVAFLLLFVARLCEKRGQFNFSDALNTSRAKMIRRHPHVFGKSMLSDQGEPVTDWDAIKKQEKAGKEWTEAYLPGALEEAEKLLERAKERKGIKK